MSETFVHPQRPDPIASLTGKLYNHPHPKGISDPGGGGKFDPKGHVQTWPGNTFICHVKRPSPEHEALTFMQDRIKQSPFARYFTFLPPTSFHMTVFQGWSPFLQAAGVWPEGLALDQTLDQTTAELCDKLGGLELPARFRVRPDGLFALHSLTMRGADSQQEKLLRKTRTTLRDNTEIPAKNFDSYIFHITLAYQLSWVDEASARDIVAFSDDLGADFERQVPQIDLGPCELCDFEDMHHFEPVMYLGGQGDK